MSPTRLEAFSDGVLAIIITIMVLELHVPHATDLAALRPLAPVLASYVLSFVYIGIYWNNHHHMLHLTTRVDGSILWANLHLLFWLSLVPFVTAWMGENHFAPVPTSAYGVVLFGAAISYWLLQRTIIVSQGEHSALAAAVGQDKKSTISLVLNLMAVPLALVQPALAGVLYAIVALIWVVPDRRIERAMAATGGVPQGE
jgi:uncharacterized membrane protein